MVSALSIIPSATLNCSQELFIRKIDFNCTHAQLSRIIADILHNEPFTELSVVRINFRITLFPDKRGGGKLHSGCGLLTLPSVEIGERFFHLYGERIYAIPAFGIIVQGKKAVVQRSNRPLRSRIVEEINSKPFVSPWHSTAERRPTEVSEQVVRFKALQFGFECRDRAFSIEWERRFVDSLRYSGELVFDSDLRQLELTFPKTESQDQISILLGQGIPKQTVSFRYASIENACLSQEGEEASIFITLNAPASFSTFNPNGKKIPLIFLDDEHKSIAPFASKALRLVLLSVKDLEEFKKLARRAHRRFLDYSPEIVHRKLFDYARLNRIIDWMRQLPVNIAFQCEALIRSGLIDPQELQSIQELVIDVYRHHGSRRTSLFLRHFGTVLNDLEINEDGRKFTESSITTLFRKAIEMFDFQAQQLTYLTDGVLDCYHANITPTAIRLSGEIYPVAEICSLKTRAIRSISREIKSCHSTVPRKGASLPSCLILR